MLLTFIPSILCLALALQAGMRGERYARTNETLAAVTLLAVPMWCAMAVMVGLSGLLIH